MSNAILPTGPFPLLDIAEAEKEMREVCDDGVVTSSESNALNARTTADVDASIAGKEGPKSTSWGAALMRNFIGNLWQRQDDKTGPLRRLISAVRDGDFPKPTVSAEGLVEKVQAETREQMVGENAFRTLASRYNACVDSNDNPSKDTLPALKPEVQKAYQDFIAQGRFAEDDPLAPMRQWLDANCTKKVGFVI